MFNLRLLGQSGGKKSKLFKKIEEITWVGLFWARRNHAVMRHFVVQCVREGRRPVFVDGHGGVIRKIRLVHHLEHVVTANLPNKWKWMSRGNFAKVKPKKNCKFIITHYDLFACKLQPRL